MSQSTLIPALFLMNSWSERNTKITQMAQTPRCDLALRYFDIEQASGIENARWQPFQINILNESSTFVSVNKGRQIGASFIFSGDALFEGLLKGNHTIIAISYNLEEAKEKIVYAKKWWEAKNPKPEEVPIREEFNSSGDWLGESPNRIARWPEMTKDNILELNWENGFRLISHPCRPPRGKRATVFLDEFAHYMHDKEIYTAALPMITRGFGGRNKIISASTPLGAAGMFWDIHCHPDKYPRFNRHDYGWWEIQDLCETKNLMKCRRDWLEGCPMEDLIEKYGTEQLQILYESASSWEDFLQEFCLAFLDSRHSFFSFELIRSCYPTYWDAKELNLSEDEQEERWENDLNQSYASYYTAWKARGAEDGSRVIRKVAHACKAGIFTGKMSYGYDCGRERDPAEISIWELKNNHHFQRAIITLPQTSYDDMEALLTILCRTVPIVRGKLDNTGQGGMIAERLNKKFGEKAEGVNFNDERKEVWIKRLKLSMERRQLTFMPDKEQESQLHAIREVVGSSKVRKYVIDNDNQGVNNKVKHHADKVWAAALGHYCSWEIFAMGGGFVGAATDAPKGSQVARDRVISKGFGKFPLKSAEAKERVISKVSSRR